MSDLSPLEDPEGHRWVRPQSAPCPNCPCCRAFVCERKEWAKYPAAGPQRRWRPCPCDAASLKAVAPQHHAAAADRPT